MRNNMQKKLFSCRIHTFHKNELKLNFKPRKLQISKQQQQQQKSPSMTVRSIYTE